MAARTLYVNLAETWPEPARAEWCLLGPRGDVLEQGESDPVHWPAAERHVACLSGAQVSVAAVSVPKARKQDRERLLAYALEEQIPTDTDGQHFTVLASDAGRVQVALIERARLARVVAAFGQLKRPLAAAYGRVFSLRAQAATVHAVADPNGCYWRWPDGSGWFEDGAPSADDSGHAPGWAVSRQVRGLEAAGGWRFSGPETLRAWAEGEGGEWLGAESVPWVLWPRPANLLHGAFAPLAGRASWGKPLRWAAGIAGLAVSLHLVLGAWFVWSGKRAEQQLRGAAEAAFLAAYPGATVVDPVLQLRRQLNTLRAERGQLRDDDLVPLLATVADVLGADARDSVRALRYADGTLDLTLANVPAHLAGSLVRQSLRMRGVSAEIEGNRWLIRRVE